MLHRTTYKSLILSGLLGIVLGGCGAGSQDNVPTDKYTGLTTPAVINQENGKQIATGAMDTSSTNQVGTLAGVTVETNKGSSARASAKRAASLGLKVQQQYSEQQALFSGVVQTYDGSCGGSVTFSGDETSFSISYSNFCDQGDLDTDTLTINGKMTISSSQPANGSTTRSASIKLENFTMKGTVGTEAIDIELSGNMQVENNLADNSLEMTINFVAIDHITNEQVKLENYKYGFNFVLDPVTSAPASMELTISGRVYLSSTGYVDITTNTPVNINQNGQLTAGSITFSGANGSKVVLTFSGNDNYSLLINDGTTETTETGSLSELNIDFASLAA